MSKVKINKSFSERCLLTEITPYETPIMFSNWGAFNYLLTLQNSNPPQYLKELFNANNKIPSVPYKYKIKKDTTDFRSLSLIHPKHSDEIVSFYKEFDVLILKACSKSKFSIRSPKGIAKYFTTKEVKENELKKIEEISSEQAYASSYFSYDKYSHLYKFFESDFFTELEKKFSKIKYLDISKCFPSLYTHSISWAFRSKSNAKANYFKHDLSKAFDDKFDQLMRVINYNETNGIVVGPELSRIFAEIILQEIDSVVFNKLNEQGIIFGQNYWCCRYVDDFFIFFNDDKDRDAIITSFNNELEKFKLYLNKEKSENIFRPFITDISIKKIEISNYFSELNNYISDISYSQIPKEINKIRSIFKGPDVKISSVSNFYFACLKGTFVRIKPEQTKAFINSTHLLLELAFHLFRMDIRVSSSFKITDYILEVLKTINVIPLINRRKILDKIYIELVNAIEYSISEGGSLECMNLLILLNELGEEYIINPSLVDDLIEKCEEDHDDEYSRYNRLSYFEIVSLLYFMKNRPLYESQRKDLIDQSNDILKEYNPLKFSESAHLLLDLISCPYLDTDEKNSLIEKAFSHHYSNTNKQQIGRIRNFVSDHTWFINWNRQDDLKSLLKKKQYSLTY